MARFPWNVSAKALCFLKKQVDDIHKQRKLNTNGRSWNSNKLNIKLSSSYYLESPWEDYTFNFNEKCPHDLFHCVWKG